MRGAHTRQSQDYPVGMISFLRCVTAWRTWLAAFVVAFGWGCMASTIANASCGDYLQHGQSHSGFHSTHQPKPLLDPEQKPEPKPCSGPFCSGSPSTPLVPATPPTLRVEQNWASPL